MSRAVYTSPHGSVYDWTLSSRVGGMSCTCQHEKCCRSDLKTFKLRQSACPIDTSYVPQQSEEAQVTPGRLFGALHHCMCAFALGVRKLHSESLTIGSNLVTRHRSKCVIIMQGKSSRALHSIVFMLHFPACSQHTSCKARLQTLQTFNALHTLRALRCAMTQTSGKRSKACCQGWSTACPFWCKHQPLQGHRAARLQLTLLHGPCPSIARATSTGSC